MTKAKILILAMLICLVTSSNIIPDAQNPLQMKFPSSTKTGQSLVFRFSLPSDSVGLTHGQFIGVRFPNDALRLAEAGTMKWNCELTDSNQKTINVSSELSASSEDSIAYCKIKEMVNVPLTAGSGYILTIRMNGQLTSSFIHNIGLFTATSNYADKIIIDSLPVYGNIGMYGDWENTTNTKPLEISTVSNSLVNTPIFPYSAFDLSLSLTVNSFININDVYILINYPSANIQAAQTISSTSYSDGALFGAVKGNLALSQFNADNLLVSGITEDLVPGRKFKIDLKQWKALDNSVSSECICKDLVLVVYYKNTFSVFSYWKSPSIFAVSKVTFSTTVVKHVEGWDIYRNGAWPLLITFKPTTDLVNGGYVLVQHVNAKTGSNKITFIPSSCDFSDNEGQDQSFGKRANCYPIRNDFVFPGASGTNDFAGHGFFFNFKSIVSSKDFKVKVWAFADNCGGDGVTLFNPITNTANSATTPSFKITIYKNIDKKSIGNNRFTNQVILADSDPIAFSGKCWNSKVSTLASGNTMIPGFNNEFFTDNTDKITITPDLSSIDSSKRDYLLFKEIHDWSIFSQTDATSTAAGGITTDITASTPESYLYTTQGITSTSYFFMRAKLYVTSIGAKVRNIMAFPLTGASITTDFTSSASFWRFSTTWFQKGDSVDSTKGCYVSWGLHGTPYDVGGANGSTTYKALIIDPTVVANAYVTHTTAATANQVTANDKFKMNRTNFVASQLYNPVASYTGLTYSPPISTIDTTNSFKNDDLKIISTIYKYTSATKAGLDGTDVYNPSATGNALVNQWVKYDWAPFPFKHTDTDITASDNPIYFGLFSSCIKWKTTTIKSIYTSVEFQYGFMYNNIVNRVNRFVKLYPEAGVFQEKAKTNVQSIVSPIIIHYSYVGKDDKAVCLLELNADKISTAVIDSTSLSNTLLVWIYYGTILETDYDDASATYPAAPLATSVNVYGMQNGVPSSNENLYYYDNAKSLMISDGGYVDVLTRVTSVAADQYSHYQLFMGSWIAVTGITSGTFTTTDSNTYKLPLLVPFYCPYNNDASATPNLVMSSQKLPLVMVTWMNMSSHSNFNVIKFVGYTTGSTKRTLVLNRTDSNMAKSATSGTITSVKLKFAQYTNTNDSILYLFNTVKAVHCTGHSLFFTKDIAIAAGGAITPNFPSSSKFGTFGVNNTKNYYVWGKAFSKAVLSGIGTYTYISGSETDNTPQITTLDTSTLSWTGIKRPNVEFFNNFQTTDIIAFYCASSASTHTDNSILSNLNSSAKFTLDYNPDTAKTWGTFTLGYDNNERIKNDIAGAITIKLNAPTNLPVSSYINLTSSNIGFNANTICGIVNSTGFVNECSTATNKVTCTAPTTASTYDICCFTVTLSAGTFSIQTLTSGFPTADDTMYNAGTLTNNNSYKLDTTVTSTGNNDPTSSNFKATITSVKYSNVKQEGGFGRAQFEVSLPRWPVRDMKITVVGDFNNMLITGVPPRCVASFSSTFGKWDSGDAIIESCSTAQFSTSTSPIVIKTKKIVYKCGLTFSKTLNIHLWPIIVANWSSTASTASYKVQMESNVNTESLSFNESFNMPSVQGLDAKPTVTPQYDNLCQVNTILPRIPGERAEYNFEFDLDLNKAALASSTPNEVTIFFPYNHFGSMVDNVLCYYTTLMTNCSFTDEGVLNIRFTAGLSVGTGKRVSIIVSGIPNPSTTADIIIPCTVNFTNFSTQKRINLITGTGKITGGISVLETASLGNIRFLSIPASNTLTSLSDSNPRNTSTHVFRFEIDRASTFNKEYSITNSPMIIVSFPQNYMLSWFPMTKPTASIDPYTNDPTTNVITKGTAITPSSVTLSGNNIIINLPATSYTFPSTFRYWDVRIGNIVGPMDATTNATRTINTSTSGYKVIFTNSNYSTIFRTYSNLNTHAYNAFTTALTPAEPFLSHYRGNTFIFDNKNWVVDIRTDSVLNSLTLSPGRYITTSFVVKQNTSGSILPSLAEIKLSDSTFKTLDTSYTIYSSLNESLPFLIGCACGTPPGVYLINFTRSVPTKTPALPENWAPLWPVQINVNNNELGTISYTNPSNIPAGGSTWVSLNLSAPNFDELNIVWTAADNSKNDPSTQLSGVKIPAGTITSATTGTTLGVSNIRCRFSITNANVFDAQSFKTENPNSCWQWPVNANIINFNIQGQTAIIPQDYVFINTITFFNSDSDSTLSKNAIRFNIKLNYAPVYLYCGLVCINNNYPNDDIIKNTTPVNTQLLQFYSGVYTTTATGSDIVFNGLIRGQKYKLRCIIESVQGDIAKRTSTSGNYDKYVAANGTTWDIMPAAPQSTYCARFLFDNEPGQETKISMINYCQRLFSAPGWATNGCIICTDSELTYTVAGISLPNLQCTAASASKLRFLQSSATNTVSTTTPSTTATTATTSTTSPTPTSTGTNVIPSTVTENKTILFTVCAIASPNCGKDVSGNKGYVDYFNQLKDDLATPEQFKKTLDIINAQVRSVTIYSDSNAPVITTETLKITALTPALTGLIKFKATFQSPIRCYYQISTSASTAAPTFDTIMNCKDSLCGSFKPSSLGVDVSTGTTSLKPLTPNAQYNIFVGCTNDIPYSQKRSAVIAASSFNAPSDATTPITNTTCPDGKTFNTTTSTCISSGFINFSFALLLIFAFLFN